MKNEVIFFWLPNCSTCKKAKLFLEANGFEFSIVRDLKAEPLSRTEVENLAKKLGGVENLFSRRAIKYREMGLNQREVLPPEMLDLIADECTFIKRPVLVIGEAAIAGFSEKTALNFIKENLRNDRR